MPRNEELDSWFNLIGFVLTFVVAPIVAYVIISWNSK